MAKKTFLLINRHSQKALQVNGTDGTAVEQSEITYEACQLWTTVGTKDKVKIINEANAKVLDVICGSDESGAGIHTWNNVETESQYWSLTVSTRGFRKITNTNSGKVLDIKDLSVEDGATAQIWDEVGGLNQEWKVVEYPEVKKPAKKATTKKKK